MKRKNKLTIELPIEFIELCEADGVTPEIVLRGFIADLAGIHNWAANPRGRLQQQRLRRARPGAGLL